MNNRLPVFTGSFFLPGRREAGNFKFYMLNAEFQSCLSFIIPHFIFLIPYSSYYIPCSLFDIHSPIQKFIKTEQLYLQYDN